MRLIDKILVATDFGKSASDALKTAIYLAREFKSEIFLIHVIPQDEIPKNNRQKALEFTQEKLVEIKRNISDKGISIREPILTTGIPFEQIIQYSIKLDVNVIIMGSGEKFKNDKFMMGITVDRVIRHSRKPVWVAKKGCPVEVQKILCPVDFSDSSERALKNGLQLARQFKAKLIILHIIKPPSGFYLFNSDAIQKEKREFSRLMQVEFDKFIKKFDLHNITLEKIVMQGNPAEKILGFIKEMKLDLVVMGSVGKTGLDKILVGSVAAKVIREISCSFLLVRFESPLMLRLEKSIATIKNYLKQGYELLESGFPEEALNMFKECLNLDSMNATALEGVAAAMQRLGSEDEARHYLNQAKYIRKNIWEKKVEYELRKQYKK